ncbi:hypothetical protein HIM_11015 [Hirsutella minnesotensis 3608]|uniref:Uncharacterized protein n=1 Tax=Hirsutella minnesotensis 3608 TaxID=1043627 RepID=A0A0F7ZFR5_9HYPO|nr:hypothetical protein HIM_11015 [Hirsutella minnesotensis 3608]
MIYDVLYDPAFSFYEGFYLPRAIEGPTELDDLGPQTAPNSPTRYGNLDRASQAGSLTAIERACDKLMHEQDESHEEEIEKRGEYQMLQPPTSEKLSQTTKTNASQTPCGLSGYKFQGAEISEADTSSQTAGNGNERAQSHDTVCYSSCLRPGSKGEVSKNSRKKWCKDQKG